MALVRVLVVAPLCILWRIVGLQLLLATVISHCNYCNAFFPPAPSSSFIRTTRTTHTNHKTVHYSNTDDADANGNITAMMADHNNSKSSPFLNTKWTVQLDFGLEPGSFMPRRFPEWAASGARLGVPVELLFTDTLISAAIVDSIPGYVLGNNNKNNINNLPVPLVVYQVQVSPTFPSTFVSARGEETVTFKGGGYTMERSTMTTPTLTSSSQQPKPRFLLRFWIDCTSGANRNDVTLQPNTRLFGTIPIWDDPDHIIPELKQELAAIHTKLQQQQQQQQQDDDDTNTNSSMDAATKSNSFMDRLFNRKSKQEMMETDEAALSYRQEQIERLLPLKGSVVCASAENNNNVGGGITIAPKGSLVMPCYNQDDDTSYLIVGAFAMRPVRAVARGAERRS